MKGLEKLIFLRIQDILEGSVLTPNGDSLFITDPNLKKWFFEYKNHGEFLFNGIIFDNGLRIFMISKSETTRILKKWFESNFHVMIRQVVRRNSDINYELDKIQKKRRDWDLKNRYGFPYGIVKKYLDCKNSEESQKVDLKKYIFT